MLYKVFARTKRTDWVELNAFEDEAAAKALAREVLNDSGAEVMIEPHAQAADNLPAH